MQNLILYVCLLYLVPGTFTETTTEPNHDYYIHPDTGLNISQLLERHGYPFEEHIVQTEDGYLLGLHRVPYGVQNTSNDTNKPVVLLVHGMGSQSTDFVNNEPERSIGLLLADRGYDVWLLNTRGNTHSRRHISIDPDKERSKFFDFSWHEVGIYDLPNTIDYILKLTNQEKLFYIGHSQGTTAFFVMAAMVPAYNEKIRHMSAMGPSAFFINNNNIGFKLLARFYKELTLASTLLNVHELFPHSPIYLDIVKAFCLKGMETYDLCYALWSLGAGSSPAEVNMTMVPVYASNSPSGFSAKEGFHYLQGFRNKGHFRQYDYGSILNRIKYGSKTPPDYNLTNIVTPIALHYGRHDQIVDYKDAEYLYTLLPNATKRMVPEELFSHIDFLFGNNAKTLLYDYIFEDMEKY